MRGNEETVASRARYVPNDSPCEDPKLKAALEALAEGCEVKDERLRTVAGCED